jgi:hypothetical protein
MPACMTELVHDPIPDDWTPEERQSRERYLTQRSVALLVIADGDDGQLRRCVDSATEMLRPRWDHFEELWMCDASGDASHTVAGEEGPYGGVEGMGWEEHRVRFARNPSLYDRSLLSIGWPERDGADGIHRKLMREGMPGTPGNQIAYAKFGAEHVHKGADSHLDPVRMMHADPAAAK